MNESNYLEQILNSGKIGILDWELDQDTILISKTLQNILGYNNVDTDMSEFSKSVIIPEKDQILINTTIKNHQSENKSDFSIQHRMIKNDGDYCWVLHNGTISYDKKRNTIRLVSSIINITDIKVSELSLKESESRYKTLFESSNEGLMLIDKDFNTILYTNTTISEMLKYPLDELVKMKLKDFAPTDIDEKLQETIHSNNSFLSDISLLRSDNQYLYVEINCIKTLIDEQENYICLIKDITERKMAEKAVKDSEEKYRELFDESVAAIYLFDSNKNFIDSNQAGLDLLGYSRNELLKMSIPDVDADPKEVANAHHDLLTGNNLVNFEHHLKRKDGTIITVLNNSKSFTDSSGNVGAIQSTLLDITKRKQSEKALQESEEKFRAFTNQTTEGITVANMEGKYVFVNPAFCKMSGYTKEELLKMTVLDMTVFDGDTKDKTKAKFSQNINSIESVRMNVKLRKKDNTEYFTEIIVKIITIGGEKFALGTVRDITQQLQAEELLKKSEKKYRNLFEFAQEGIWVIDADSFTTLVNKSMADMLGYSEEEMIGKHLFDFMDTQGVELAKNYIKRRESGIKEQHDFEFITKSGKRIITTIETAPIYDDDKKNIGAIAGVINITDRKAAETALRESKKQYDEILDRSNAVVYVKDLNHKYIYVNLKFKKILNLPMEDLINKTDYELFPKETADILIENDMKVLSRQKHYRVQEDIVNDDGLHTYISDKFPLFDSNSKIYATCGISTDITDLLDAQNKEKQIQQQLVRKDRLIHAGHLAAGVAHEINNPMTVLHGSLEEIKESKDALTDDVIDVMLHMSRRIKKIISNLLIFTSQTEQNLEKVDINTIVNNTFLLISNLLHKSLIEFSLDLSKDKLVLEADPIQLQQVFINIIFNAMHAMKGGGQLKVKTYIQNNNICISFEDNGYGIAEENLKSIFLPFYTTKEVGEGTGLGLSISHGIIKEHGGTISVISKVNKGTTFTITFPTS